MWLTKYNANGNDFLIFHTFNNMVDSNERANLAIKLCNRHTGIGADGLVIISPHSIYTYEWDFYNSDGSKANMCGNASRCVAHYAYHNKLAPIKHTFLSGAGEIKVEIQENNTNIVEVNFGEVKLVEENIVEDGLQFYLLDSGVPHLVRFDSDIPKQKTGFMKFMRDKYDANVNIASIISNNTINIVTYERGVEDITLACGTGMAATYYVALIKNKIDNNARITPPGGGYLYFRMDGNEVCYKGEVNKICDIIV